MFSTKTCLYGLLVLLCIINLVHASHPKVRIGETHSFPNYVSKHLRKIPLEQQTALDQYMLLPTPNYGYTLLTTVQDEQHGVTIYTFNMTSVEYLTPAEVTCSYWHHWLVIVVPEYVNPVYANKAVMLIAGGGRGASAPRTKDTDIQLFASIAGRIGAVAVILDDIPNEPCQFTDDPEHMNRNEDAIIAYGWNKFLQNPNQPQWLIRLPMVKSAILALDTVQHFMNVTYQSTINEFVTAGASKRGWTTWLTAAVDTRIVGICPIVMDELNFMKNIMHHYEAYNGWSFAIEPYRAQNITADFYNSNTQALFDIEDPYVYRDRVMNLPKLQLSTSGDEFFLVDDSLYWITDMGNYMWQRMFPNCEHSLETCILDVAESIESFIVGIWNKETIPNFDWNIDSQGTITVTPQELNNAPLIAEARVWTATTIVSTGRRDFRLVALGPNGKPALQLILWSSTVVQPVNNVYTIPCEAPAAGGWRGCYVTFQSAAPSGFSYYFSTPVSVVPQTFPSPPCTSSEQCYGSLV